MKDLQEIFNQIQEKKKTQKDLNKMYKDALASVEEYKGINEQLKTLRERKKQIEISVRKELGGQYLKLDEIKNDISTDEAMLTDAAMSTLMGGQTVEATDEYGNKYEPVFRVSFKKTK